MSVSKREGGSERFICFTKDQSLLSIGERAGGMLFLLFYFIGFILDLQNVNQKYLVFFLYYCLFFLYLFILLQIIITFEFYSSSFSVLLEFCTMSA